MNYLFGCGYPAGAEHDPDAPYNQVEVPDKEFDVLISQTLSKSATVITNNYIPGASGVDYDSDDEGGCVSISYQEPDDTSDTDWEKEYSENDHYTPIQLIGLYKETLEEQLKSWEGLEDTPAGRKEIRRIKHLIEECEDWTDDETEVVEN